MEETPPQTAIVKAEPRPISPPLGRAGIAFQNMDDIFRFAKAVAMSGLAPKGMEKPEAIFVAVQLGLELGLSPMAGLQNIGVINGRPGIYGDAALALVRASGLLEDYVEEPVGKEGTDDFGYQIESKRKGMSKPVKTTFTVKDAKTAQLWGKGGPWTQYPKRMLMWRARGFNLRDNFGDVLKGLRTTEELSDYPSVEITSETELRADRQINLNKPREALKEPLPQTTAPAAATPPAGATEPEKPKEEPPKEEKKKKAPVTPTATTVPPAESKPAEAPAEFPAEAPKPTAEKAPSELVKLRTECAKAGITEPELVAWAKAVQDAVLQIAPSVTHLGELSVEEQQILRANLPMIAQSILAKAKNAPNGKTAPNEAGNLL